MQTAVSPIAVPEGAHVAKGLLREDGHVVTVDVVVVVVVVIVAPLAVADVIVPVAVVNVAVAVSVAVAVAVTEVLEPEPVDPVVDIDVIDALVGGIDEAFQLHTVVADLQTSGHHGRVPNGDLDQDIDRISWGPINEFAHCRSLYWVRFLIDIPCRTAPS